MKDWRIKMGADIHAFLEGYDKVNKCWVPLILPVGGYFNHEDKFVPYSADEKAEYWHEGVYNMLGGRNYALFGYLAGVRGSDAPIDILRGVPDDASDYVKNIYAPNGEPDGYHSATWYDYTELALFAKTPDAICNYYDYKTSFNPVEDFAAKIANIAEVFKIYWPKPGELRVIVWFDS